jgi:hypothetical protein
MSETQTQEKPADLDQEPATDVPPASETPDAGAVDTAPCYCCGSRRGVPAAAAYWGIVWPRVLGHVRCVDCPVTYNARTGRSNGGWILALHLAHLLVGVAIAGLIYVTVYRTP